MNYKDVIEPGIDVTEPLDQLPSECDIRGVLRILVDYRAPETEPDPVEQ